MFSVILTKEQFLSSLNTLSDNEIDTKISHFKEMILLIEQVKSQRDTTSPLWYLSTQLLSNEAVVNKIQTYGNDLKVPKDIEITDTGRVFYKGRLLEPLKDSHGNFGVWYPHVGWQTKSNGISYRARYEFSSPEENEPARILYSINKDFFDEIDSQWQSRCHNISQKNDTKNHKERVNVIDRYSGIGETDSGIPYTEEGVYLGDGVYIDPQDCPF